MRTTTELSTSFHSDVHSDIQRARELSLDELDNVNAGLAPLDGVAAALNAVFRAAGRLLVVG